MSGAYRGRIVARDASDGLLRERVNRVQGAISLFHANQAHERTDANGWRVVWDSDGRQR